MGLQFYSFRAARPLPSEGRRRGSGYVANFTMAGFAVSGYMLRAHQTRTMKKHGPPHAGKRVLYRTFRLSPEIFVPQQEVGPASCSGLRLRPRNGMRKLRQSGAYAPPRRFPAAPAAVFRDSGLGNALQINPPPLQRSYNTLAKPAICSGKALFPQTNVLGGHIELLARYIPSPERLLAPKKSDFPPKTKCGLPPPESALFWAFDKS